MGLALLGLARTTSPCAAAAFLCLGAADQLVATWADVPGESRPPFAACPPEERLRAGGIRSAALFLAAVVGGGLLLVVHERSGEAVPFVLMALLLAVGGLLLRWTTRYRQEAGRQPYAQWERAVESLNHKGEWASSVNLPQAFGSLC